MKNLNKQIFALILFTGLIVLGCSKKDSDPPIPDNGGDGIFTATVSGNILTSDQDMAKAVHTYGYGGSDLYALVVSGVDETSQTSILFRIISTTEHQPGTFQITFISSNAAYYYENFETPTVVAWVAPDYTTTDLNFSHGTVSFTEITQTRAKGTFNFIARETPGTSIREITNGSFDVPLTRQGF